MKIFVTSKDKMPKEKHWAIVEYGSVFIPGDERSRTNPGHGYPASSQPVTTYYAFTDQAEWENEIQMRESVGKLFDAYSAFEVTPAKITKEVKVGFVE